MRPFLSILAPLSLLAAPVSAAPRPTDEERLQTALKGLVPGKATQCIHQGRAIQSETYAGAILYRDGATRYLNRFDGTCRYDPAFDILVTTLPTGSLCRGDIARIVSRGGPIERGSCVYGEFTPYTKAK